MYLYTVKKLLEESNKKALFSFAFVVSVAKGKSLVDSILNKLYDKSSKPKKLGIVARRKFNDSCVGSSSNANAAVPFGKFK